MYDDMAIDIIDKISDNSTFFSNHFYFHYTILERGENMQKMTLKMLRVANGLNQKQAAELVGVSTDTWGHWERCQTEPTISMAYHIANKFNMNLDDIIFLPKIAV